MTRWRGVDKPAGVTNFHVPTSYKGLIDCPKCKYGTLAFRSSRITCIDCGQQFYEDELIKLGVIKEPK